MSEPQELSLALFPEIDPDPAIRFAHDGKVLYANPATSEYLRGLGIDPSHAEKLFPADLSQRLDAMKLAQKVTETWEYPVQDRAIRCFIHFLAAYDVFHAYLTDITETKQAQEIASAGLRMGNCALDTDDPVMTWFNFMSPKNSGQVFW